MKKTRKQKLRRELDRKEEARQLKGAIVDRLLKTIELEEPLAPILGDLREEFIKDIGPRVEVVASERSADDLLVELVRRDIEAIVERPVPVEVGGRRVVVSLGDLYRGYRAVSDLIEGLFNYLQRTRITRPSAAVPGFREAWARLQQFESHGLHECRGRLLYQLSKAVDEHLRYDEQIVWYRVERNTKYSHRMAHRIVVGKKPQVPHYLPFDGQRRKCFPCELVDPLSGLAPLTWKPAEVGVGDSGKELPVYISDHALARLYERIPLAPHFEIHNLILRIALERPRIHPSSREGEFLVEAGDPGKKLGYFVVAVTPDFIYVKTFLVLTMQGTPEARLLRIKAGLNRTDITAFRLDNLYTLGDSDIGQDAELRALLVECGCGHLLDMFKHGDRLSWLDKYGDSLRRAVRLPVLEKDGRDAGEAGARKTSMEAMAAYSDRLLKACQGWTT